jgi:glutamine synthetase
MYILHDSYLSAGLDGLRRAAPLRPSRTEEVNSSITKATLLPVSLEESLSALQADKVLVDALGEPFVRWLVIFQILSGCLILFRKI